MRRCSRSGFPWPLRHKGEKSARVVDHDAVQHLFIRAGRLQFMLLGASSRIAGELGPTGVKYAMDCVGYYGGAPRPPLLPLSEAQKKAVETALADSPARQKMDHLGVAG